MDMPQSAPPRLLYNSQQISKGIQRMAQGILSIHPQPQDVALIGVHSGGDLLVRRVEQALAALTEHKLNLDKGLIDISFYRDDWSRLGQVPTLRDTDIPFDVNNRDLVLVDDVIFTGRTTRSALEAIFSQGRPARVDLAVLVDRGHRELPLSPQVVGHTLPTQRDQSVNVFLYEDQAKDHAVLEDRKYHL